MTRGTSLSKDLQFLVNNLKYSDIVITCAESVKLHGCRAILAARSEVFDRLLYNGKKDSEIKFEQINSQAMKIILEFIYTGDFTNGDLSSEILIDAYSAAVYFQLLNLQVHIIDKLEEILSNNSKENVSPHLLTKAVGGVIPNSDQPLTDLLAKCVTKIPLETIPYGSLSSPALQFLLMYCTKKNISLAKNPYSTFRYVVLHAANQVEQEISDDVFKKTEACLPPLNKILENERVVTSKKIVDPENIEGLSPFRTKLTEKLSPMLNYANIKLISGGILAEIIEPLNIVPFKLILETYRYKVKQEPIVKLEEEKEVIKQIDFTWDINVCGPNLDISDDGYTIETPSNLRFNERVRASQPITGTGLYEWDIIIENPSSSDWVGICGEGEVTNYNCTDYNSKAWILGTTGMVSNNGQSINYGSPSFQQGTKIRVHLDMGKRERRVSFSINDVKYPEVLHWKNIPAKVYPLVSLRYPGRLKIQQKSDYESE
ncbi:11614_t:CDS:2 [Diversispora eburnea]|uniref:11614_t:CDS:1 n=1 Tax=Diversispora eburnea TaxID=1213867 RepID=A0A9N9BLW8_9GLOM|nr:11614_t:CDS:2 [Diversispora eburnea]